MGSVIYARSTFSDYTSVLFLLGDAPEVLPFWSLTFPHVNISISSHLNFDPDIQYKNRLTALLVIDNLFLARVCQCLPYILFSTGKDVGLQGFFLFYFTRRLPASSPTRFFPLVQKIPLKKYFSPPSRTHYSIRRRIEHIPLVHWSKSDAPYISEAEITECSEWKINCLYRGFRLDDEVRQANHMPRYIYLANTVTRITTL